MTDSAVEAVARDADLKFAVELILGNTAAPPETARHIASRLFDALPALGWLPPEAQASIERAALVLARDAIGKSAWKHNGDDAYSQGMDAGAVHQVKACYEAADAMLALLPSTPQVKDGP